MMKATINLCVCDATTIKLRTTVAGDAKVGRVDSLAFSLRDRRG